MDGGLHCQPLEATLKEPGVGSYHDELKVAIYYWEIQTKQRCS